MILRHFGIIVFIVFIRLTAYSQGSTNDENLIKKAADDFSASYVKGDYQAMANTYTEDAVLMSPGQDMIYGREAIYKFWSKDTAYHQVFHRSVSDQLEVLGDLAFDNGFWYSQANYNGKERPLFSGKYLIIWKKDEEGNWKMYHDIWNNRASGWQEKEEFKK
ncbi:MAG: DUF4440 domain-containing protein [Cyclobacteriaceae bacterium]